MATEEQNEDLFEVEEVDQDNEEAWDDLDDTDLSEVEFDEKEF